MFFKKEKRKEKKAAFLAEGVCVKKLMLFKKSESEHKAFGERCFSKRLLMFCEQIETLFEIKLLIFVSICKEMYAFFVHWK